MLRFRISTTNLITTTTSSTTIRCFSFGSAGSNTFNATANLLPPPAPLLQDAPESNTTDTPTNRKPARRETSNLDWNADFINDFNNIDEAVELKHSLPSAQTRWGPKLPRYQSTLWVYRLLGMSPMITSSHAIMMMK